MASSKKRCIADLLGIPCTAGTYNLVVTDCENFAWQATTGGGGTTAPGVVTGLGTSYTSGCSVTLTWTVGSQATSYKVYRNGILNTTTTGTTVTITESGDGVVNYGIQSVNSVGESSIVTTSVTVTGCSVQLPANVTNLSTTYTCGTSGNISWTVPGSGFSYQILVDGTPVGVSSVTSFSLTGLSVGVSLITVKTVSGGNYSTGASISINVEACIGLPVVASPTLSGTTETGTTGNATYTGTGITATGFIIYPSGNSSTVIGGAGVVNFPDGTLASPITSSITGLTAGTAYCSKAYATNTAGTAYSGEVCFTTVSAPAIWDTIVPIPCGSTTEWIVPVSGTSGSFNFNGAFNDTNCVPIFLTGQVLDNTFNVVGSTTLNASILSIHPFAPAGVSSIYGWSSRGPVASYIRVTSCGSCGSPTPLAGASLSTN